MKENNVQKLFYARLCKLISDKRNKKTDLILNNRKGIALIVTVGVLAIAVLVGITFAMNMQLEQKAAFNYMNQTKVKYLAEAGIERVIADVRKNVKDKAYSDLTAYIKDTYNGPKKNNIENHGYYTVELQNESEKVNLNTLTNTDKDAIDLLKYSAGLSYPQIAKIIDYRDGDDIVTTRLYTSSGWKSCEGEESLSKAKNATFTNIEEIKLVSGIGEGTYEKAMDYITVNKPIIRGGLLAKYYKGLTGTSPNVKINEDRYLDTIIALGSICEVSMEGSDGPPGGLEQGWDESHDANFAGGYLMNKLGGGWTLDDFAVIYEGYIDILPGETGMPIAFLFFVGDGVRLYIDNELVADKWRDGFDGGFTGYHTFKYAGWHPIKIEFYDVVEAQVLELQWKTAVYQDGYAIPADRFGYEPPMGDDYYQDGYYKINSTGTIEAKDGTGKVIAEKKISAVVKTFGTWTQTTRSEFSAAWSNSESDDYRNGGVRWVTWLDNCPVDEDGWVDKSPPAKSGMHWDIDNYDRISDALKLGYWDNFDEDIAYSVVNMQHPGDSGEISYDQINSAAGTEVSKVLNLVAEPGNDIAAQLNTSYYNDTGTEGWAVFARTWENDWGQKTYNAIAHQDDPVWGFSASKRNASATGTSYPEHPDCKGEMRVERAGKDDFFSVSMGDTDDDTGAGEYTLYQKDYFELAQIGGLVALYDTNGYYKQDKSMAFIGDEDKNYWGYINGNNPFFKCQLTGKLTDTINFQLCARNSYNMPKDVPAAGRALSDLGAFSKNAAHFDNVRVIPQEGFLVSTPFFAGPGKIDWGTVSWHSEESGNTGVDIYLRTASKTQARNFIVDTSGFFPNSENAGFSVKSNDSQIDSNANWIQYKAVLKSNAITTSDYSASCVTPVLKDITLTYLPQAEILYWREETE
ncbi:MAG: hypothetical protein ABH836_01725 [Candidatus Omnitrophota bacterium]